MDRFDDQETENAQADETIELSDDILSILGEDNSQTESQGPKLQKDVAARWINVLKNGLNADERKKTLEKYPPPSNCMLLKAPALNLEVRAAVTDSVLRRDERLAQLQDQIGGSLSCISSVVTMMLKEEGGGTESTLSYCMMPADS